MELTCTGRGIHVTEEMRASATRKLARVERLVARATRLEVEIIVEKNPRRAHLKRLEAALHTPRRIFRAHGEDTEFESALDEVEVRFLLQDHLEPAAEERMVVNHHHAELLARAALRPLVRGQWSPLSSASFGGIGRSVGSVSGF